MISMEILDVLGKMAKLMYDMLPEDRTDVTGHLLGNIPKLLSDLFLDIQSAKEKHIAYERYIEHLT